MSKFDRKMAEGGGGILSNCCLHLFCGGLLSNFDRQMSLSLSVKNWQKNGNVYLCKNLIDIWQIVSMSKFKKNV